MPPATSLEERVPITRRLVPWLMVLWTALWTFNAFRAMRFPHPFAKGFWLYHYQFGFVKRGLPGAIVEPWIRGKTPDEIHTFLNALGLTIYIVSTYVTLAWARRVLGREDSTPAWCTLVLGTTVFVLSPYVVSEANLTGYFDHLLVIGTVGGVALIERRRVGLAGMLAAACLLTHEMFLLFGLPVLCLALALQRADEGPPARLRAEVHAWSRLLLPPIVLALVIARAGMAGLYVEPGTELYARADALGVVDPVWLQTSFHPLHVPVIENMAQQAPRLAMWLTSDFAVEVVHPTTAILLLLASCMWWIRRRALMRARVAEVVGLVAVVLSPMAIAAIGWDWARFLMLSHFHGFAALMVISSARAWEPRGRVPLVLWGAMLGASVVAVDGSIRDEIILTAPGAGIDRAFTLHRPDEYACARPLFPNSDFSEATLAHWEAEGVAFFGQPLVEDAPARRGSPAEPIGNWVGTYEATPSEVPGGSVATAANASAPRKTEGDAHRGRLRSRPFRIEGDRIVFRVSGGWDERRLFVRLLVDGEERGRATGRNRERLATRHWNVGRHRGKEGVIEIVDESDRLWGHINAEGFCYAK